MENPTIVGFLAQKDNIEVFIMELPHEALYLEKSLGIVAVPSGPSQIEIILEGLGTLLTAKAIANRTYERFCKRDRTPSTCKPARCRPSYFIHKKNDRDEYNGDRDDNMNVESDNGGINLDE